MSDLSTPLGDGHTVLSEDDRADLLQPDITTRQELFEAEQLNIATALLRPKPSLPTLLDDKYLRDLHKAMFSDVWGWAGRYRKVGAFVDFDGLPGGFGSPTCGPGVDDGLADFSNTGPNIDILAPGVCIETVGLNGDESTVVPSGTSLAAAHVAGVAAIYKACHVDAAPDEVRTALLAAAETVSIEDVDFSLVSAWEFDRNSCRDVNHDA